MKSSPVSRALTQPKRSVWPMYSWQASWVRAPPRHPAPRVSGISSSTSKDLWFEEKGEIVVVDYKTDAQVHGESYTPQLALYALAIERALGKRPAQAWLHFLRSDTLVEVPLNYPVDSLLAELREAQDTLRFELREADRCRSCPFYRGLCPAGLSASPAPPAAQTPSRSAAVF